MIRFEQVTHTPEEMMIYPLSNYEKVRARKDRGKGGGATPLQITYDLLIHEVDDFLDPEDEPLPPVRLGGPIYESEGVVERRQADGAYSVARGRTNNGYDVCRRHDPYRETGLVPPSASPGQWPIMFCTKCSSRAVIYKAWNQKHRNQWRALELWLHLNAVCVKHSPDPEFHDLGGDVGPLDGWRRIQGLTLPQHRALRSAVEGRKVYAASPTVAFIDRPDRANYLLRRRSA